MVAMLPIDEAVEPGQQLVCLHTLIAEDLVEELAERSQFIKTQFECAGGGGGNVGAVKVPATAGKLWAAAFFQDEDMVKTLCDCLGCCLLDAGSEQPSNTEHMTLVLQALPVDVAMQVLRGAPGSFMSKFMHLPDALRPMAALAEHPGLAAACTLPVEGSASDPDLPTLTLCVDTTGAAKPIMHATESSRDPPSSMEDMEKAVIWLHVITERTPENEGRSLYSLKQRAGTVACRLLAKETTMQDLTINLEEGTCIVFDPGSGSMHLKNITFGGGAVTCMGSGCHVTFEDCVFLCPLIVIAGAHATLVKPQFQDMDCTVHRLSIVASGAASNVVIQGGSIFGGRHGVVVQAGAHLEASNLSITSVTETGVEVKDEGSSLALTDCTVNDAGMVGVQIGGGASGRLDRCTLAQGSIGLDIRDPESRAIATHCQLVGNAEAAVFAFDHARVNMISCMSSGNGNGHEEIAEAGYSAREWAVVELTNCTSDRDKVGCTASYHGRVIAHNVNVTRSHYSGFYAYAAGQMVLRECSSANCQLFGMWVADEDSQLDAEGCELSQNVGYGVVADSDAVAVVRGCCSSGNEMGGYWAKAGAQMTVSNSSSDADAHGGCMVNGGGQLTMVEVTVEGVSKSCVLQGDEVV